MSFVFAPPPPPSNHPRPHVTLSSPSLPPSNCLSLHPLSSRLTFYPALLFQDVLLSRIEEVITGDYCVVFWKGVINRRQLSPLLFLTAPPITSFATPPFSISLCLFTCQLLSRLLFWMHILAKGEAIFFKKKVRDINSACWGWRCHRYFLIYGNLCQHFLWQAIILMK